MNSPEFIKEFSKKQSQEDQDLLAQNIRKTRSEYNCCNITINKITMKKILILGFIVAAVLVGYFFYTKYDKKTVSNIDEKENSLVNQSKDEITGVVTGIDLSKIAVDGPGVYTIKDQDGVERKISIPSMGITVCAAFENISHVWDTEIGDEVSVYGDINQNNEIIPCENKDHYIRVMSDQADQSLKYKFTYTKGPNGYILVPDKVGLGDNFLDGVVLFDRSQYAEFQNSTEAREGPPSISVRVYENVMNQEPLVWAIDNTIESNYNLKNTEPIEIVVDGEDGVQYVTDGLWYTDTQIISHEDKIYVIMGAIPNEQEVMLLEYSNILNSFEFITVNTQ